MDTERGLRTPAALGLGALVGLAALPFALLGGEGGVLVGRAWAALLACVAAVLADRKSSHTRKRRWIWRAMGLAWALVAAGDVASFLVARGTGDLADVLARHATLPLVLSSAALVPTAVCWCALVAERVRHRPRHLGDALVVTVAYATLATAFVLPALTHASSGTRVLAIFRVVADVCISVGVVVLVLVSGRLVGYRLLLVISGLTLVSRDLVALATGVEGRVWFVLGALGAALVIVATRMPLRAPRPLTGRVRVLATYVTVILLLSPVVLLAAFVPETPGWILALGFLWLAVAAGRLASGLGAELSRTRTQRDSLMGELAHQNEELAGRVLATASELEEYRRRTEVRERFSQMVNHEMRTPLTVVSGFAQTLVLNYDTLDDEMRIDLAQSILRGSARLRGLIEDVRDQNAMERGAFELRRRETTAGSVVSDVEEAFVLIRRGQNLVTSIDGDASAPFLADPDRLAQVLRNLLENAAKFAPADSEIDLGVVVRGESLHVRVRDHGPGVPPERLESVFEAFQTYDETNVGTGLGLSICKGIVEAHGGHIHVENAPGGGAVFAFDVTVDPVHSLAFSEVAAQDAAN